MNECLTIGEPLVVFAAEEADVPLAAAKHFTKYLAGAFRLKRGRILCMLV